jgi:Protein of unknown function (DUF2854)
MIGRPKGLPRRQCPRLTALREEVVDGNYALVLVFQNRNMMTEEQWIEREPKFGSFFGPGVTAKVCMATNVSPKHSTVYMCQQPWTWFLVWTLTMLVIAASPLKQVPAWKRQSICRSMSSTSRTPKSCCERMGVEQEWKVTKARTCCHHWLLGRNLVFRVSCGQQQGNIFGKHVGQIAAFLS